MNKILVIGQAPPAVKQSLPYDTTMIYDWLAECGVSKEKAQEIFDWDAVYNKFPGWNMGESHTGGHRIPTLEQMDSYWEVLNKKITEAKAVIILGNVAKDYISTKKFFVRPSSSVLYLMHPSKMNFNRYNKNKEKTIEPLKKFLKLYKVI